MILLLMMMMLLLLMMMMLLLLMMMIITLGCAWGSSDKRFVVESTLGLEPPTSLQWHEAGEPRGAGCSRHLAALIV